MAGRIKFALEFWFKHGGIFMNKLFLVAGAAAIATAAPAQAAFTLQNTNGADGFVNVLPDGFQLFGGNNGVGASQTSYTDVSAIAQVINFAWTYTTNDVDGSSFDPAGYLVGGVRFQLSPNNLSNGQSASGTGSFSVAAGQSYGFYVAPVDTIAGRANIRISGLTGAVPEPSTWALMLIGFFGLGAAVRRQARQNVAVSYA
jgi:hypothetical protein